MFPRNLQTGLSCSWPLIQNSHPNFREVITNKACTPSKTSAHGFFTVQCSCLFECSCFPAWAQCAAGRIQSGEGSLWKEPFLRVGYVWLESWRKVPQSRCNAAGCSSLLQQQGMVGRSITNPDGSGYPPFLARWEHCSAKPHKEKGRLCCQTWNFHRHRLCKENSGTRTENFFHQITEQSEVRIRLRYSSSQPGGQP